MTEPSFYWHDYETFGTDPRRDRPVQFAGVRTNLQFNPVDDPLVVYLKPADDCLPHPDACLITGITPQLAEQNGICEAEFIHLIHQQIAHSNTCTLGYNNLRFDDEVTRNCLYRNFYDPYAREWQNGNSRWDLIDVVRAARALRPDGISWPVSDDGTPTIRLDRLTVANGLVHESAHDALSDVQATISLAQLIEQAQPKLYQFLFQHRVKTEALKMLQIVSFVPVVHVSGKYPSNRHCLAIVLPVAWHPTNGNGVIVYDLATDPEPMLELSVEQICQRIFTATENLPEGAARIPLKTIHLNKCPVLAPISVIRPQDAERLAIDLATCNAHIAKIKAAKGLAEKIAEVFNAPPGFESDSDPDLTIYQGGFFSDEDKRKMTRIRSMTPEQLAASTLTFADPRLPEMLFRYRARNYPASLNSDEQQRWRQFCSDRLTGRKPGAGITFDQYFARLQDLKYDTDADIAMLSALEAYAFEKMRRLGIESASANNTLTV
ncbi:MAG: exodeoxyribonuclease I [Methylococcaceae bacterium]|nr:exodeoxyribonuclease I [Methylococcaceae bacterium]